MRRHSPWLCLTAACVIGLVSYAEAADPLPGEFIVRTYLKNTLLTAHDGDSDAVDAVVTTATSIGPYERFNLTLTPRNDVTFQTTGGHYLSASGNIRPGNGDPRRALQAYATSPNIGTTHFRLVNPYNPPGHTNIARPWMGYFTIQTSSPYFLTAVGGGDQPTAAFHTDALKPNTWEYFWVLKCGDLGSGYTYSFRPAGTGSPGQPKESWLRTDYYGEGRMRTSFAVIPTGYKLIRQDDGSYALALETRNAVTYLTAVGGGGLASGDNLHTDATQVKAWEKFRVVDRGDCTYTVQTVDNWYLGVDPRTGEISTRISDPDAAPSIGYTARFELVMRGL
jgi:hypothetical protein